MCLEDVPRPGLRPVIQDQKECVFTAVRIKSDLQLGIFAHHYPLIERTGKVEASGRSILPKYSVRAADDQVAYLEGF